MKYQKIIGFFIVTTALITIAFFIAESRAPQTTVEKKILFPELADKINDVAHIEVVRSNDDTILQKTANGQWVLQSADNYPAQFEKIKGTVIGLSKLRILARKTDNPKLYAELGVEGTEIKESSSLLLTLKDAAGSVLASLIVGDPRKSGAGSGQPGFYVRKVNAKHALLVEGYLQIEANHNSWFDRNIVNISAARMRNINIVKNNGEQLTINKSAKGDTDFEVTQGETSSPAVLLDKLGTFLENMNVEDVHAASNFASPDETTTVTFRTFDGLVITVVASMSTDGKAFASFSSTTVARSDADAADAGDGADNEKSEDVSATINVEEESQLLNQSLGDWIYEIPEFKFETLDVSVSQ